MLPSDKVANYRKSLEPKLTPEQLEEKQRLEDEAMAQIYADRHAAQQARVERLKQRIAEEKKKWQ
jgi:hypothetical protein